MTQTNQERLLKNPKKVPREFPLVLEFTGGGDPDTGATSVQEIFGGGHIVRGPALVNQVVQDGKKAGLAIHEYIRQRSRE